MRKIYPVSTSRRWGKPTVRNHTFYIIRGIMTNKKDKHKIWIENNREKIRESDRKYYKENCEQVKEKNKRWALKNPEKVNEIKRRWEKNNPEKKSEMNKIYCIKNSEKINERNRNRRKTDLKYNFNRRMGAAIKISLKGNKDGCHWESLLGYSLKDLIKRLKKTMPRGYGWNDYLQGKLHIDHIIPKSVFNFTKSEHIDFKRCWALSNLRLLPAKENLIKGSKLTKPFQPALQI